ncbi:LacI family DNA-binding transcriptional regulator [Promicromonospora panici]|uniref:LacI family DNA-binding transcriptional regulator n=1 Tax=Promicromonospora panici TaxID=2219658 RepID=UPI00101B5C91|nr:LacI family DNA-binding transcriptional regulator [Promicromonospora panici]
METRRRPPGLVDVAAKAGVSLSTVSRVLTGRTPVSEKLRTKVQAAVDELGYRPNAAAQTLVSGKRSTIGVFARNTARFGYAATLQGIEEAARAAGYVVMITVIESRRPDDIARAVDMTLSQAQDGDIVIGNPDGDAPNIDAVTIAPYVCVTLTTATRPGAESSAP